MNGLSASHIQSLSQAPLMLPERHHFAFSRPHSLCRFADLSMSLPISRLWMGDSPSFTLNFTLSLYLTCQAGWFLSSPSLRMVPLLSVLYRKHWVASPHPVQALPLDPKPQPDTQPSCALRGVFEYQMLLISIL